MRLFSLRSLTYLSLMLFLWLVGVVCFVMLIVSLATLIQTSWRALSVSVLALFVLYTIMGKLRTCAALWTSAAATTSSSSKTAPSRSEPGIS